MDQPTRVKLGLALAAGIFFAVGLWLQDERFRWVAITLLVVAVLLRFVWPSRRPGDE